MHPDYENSSTRLSFIEQSRNKNLARKIAVSQDQLVRNIVQIANTNSKIFDELKYYCDEKTLLVYTDGDFQGFEDVNIALARSLTNDKKYYQKVGVDTMTILSLGLQTDRKAWDAIKENYSNHIDIVLPSQVSSNNPATYYLVDQKGNFAKVISIPEDLLGDRKDLEIEGHHIVGEATIQAPMYARDFVILGDAVNVLRKRVGSDVYSHFR